MQSKQTTFHCLFLSYVIWYLGLSQCSIYCALVFISSPVLSLHLYTYLDCVNPKPRHQSAIPLIIIIIWLNALKIIDCKSMDQYFTVFTILFTSKWISNTDIRIQNRFYSKHKYIPYISAIVWLKVNVKCITIKWNQSVRLYLESEKHSERYNSNK